MNRRKKKLKFNSDFVFVATVYFIIIFVMIVTLYPLLYVISASISDPQAVASGRMMLLPIGTTLDGYKNLMKYKDIWTGYGNTLFYTIVGTLINLVVTLPAAFALSRKDMKYRGIIMGLFVFTMYFNGGLMPSYLNVKSFNLLNTRTFILINGAVSVYNLIVARSFFQSAIPWELQEAAQIDGASKTKVFLQIVMPLAKSIVAVMTLYYGVARWNSYFTEMIYLDDRAKWPLQLFLKEILLRGEMAASSLMNGDLDAASIQSLMKQSDTANQMKYGVIVVSSLPMMILYPILQKFFNKGVMIGSIKG